MKAHAALLIACILVLGRNCHADPKLPTLFSDHMILQQHRAIHIWGKGDPSERITVSLLNETAKTTTDKSGHWSLDLPPLPAGGPFTLIVEGKTKVVIKDVMIGEVWLASGQSNMTFSLARAEGGEAEVPAADYPQVRLFTVPKKIATHPQEDTLPASWQICTPETAREFSAVGYFFARELHTQLNVPVGIILSAWPGTQIENWLDPGDLQADRDLQSVLEAWNQASPEQKQFADHPATFDLEFDDFELIPASAATPGVDLTNFDAGTSRTSMGGSFSYSWVDAADSHFDLVAPGRNGKGMAAQVAGTLDGTQSSRLTANYKLDHSPVDLSAYSGIRFWVRGNGSYRFRSLQPNITDWDNYTTPTYKAMPEWQPVTVRFRDLRQEGWGVSLPLTQSQLSGFAIECLTTLEEPPIPVSALYLGMIAPLLPYAARGVLWYQGESNALTAHQYRKLLPALIQGWRDGSKNQELEFLIVQLPNHGATPEQPGDSAWAELREAQLFAFESTPHTGLAVTIDVGDPKDVHPHRKLEVGQRLGWWALGTIYEQPLTYSGPLYRSIEIEGKEARIHFTHVGDGLESRSESELRGFAIAGADHKFHWADARIDGDTVVVSNPTVANPVAVRYAWADSPRCNLFNKNGLPASPFRTDDWPGITAGH